MLRLGTTAKTLLAAVVCSLSLGSTAPASASPYITEVSHVERTSSDGLLRVIHLSFRTAEGMHRVALHPADKISKQQKDIELFAGKLRGSKMRVIGADLTAKALTLRYIGRRGRAYLVKIPRNSKKASIAMVPKSFPLGCASHEGGAATLGDLLPITDAALPVSNTYRVLEVGAYADAEFSAARGAATQAFLDATFNTIRAQYEAQLRITLQVSYPRLFSSRADQPLQSLVSDRLLNQFREFVALDSTALNAVDTNHLFTGKDLENTVVGLAYLGSVCRSSGQYSFGLTQLVPEPAQWIVTAHELGHNLNASHTQLGAGIMSPSIDTSLSYFTAQSVKQITDYAEKYGSCLSATGPSVKLSTRLRNWTNFNAAFQVTGVSPGQLCAVSVYGSTNKNRLLSDPGNGKFITAFAAPYDGTYAFAGRMSKGRANSRKYYFAAEIQCVQAQTLLQGGSSVTSVTSRNNKIFSKLGRRLAQRFN